MASYLSSAARMGSAFVTWLILSLMTERGATSCVEYEKVINGSGVRLRTCPLDHPPSYVYCCVDTCCEEPHLAILLTSIIGGVVISVIGVGLIVLCIIDVHRMTCNRDHDLESPLISDEEDDLDDARVPPGKWFSKHNLMGATPGDGILGRRSDVTSGDQIASLESSLTCATDVTSLNPTPVETLSAIPADEDEDEDDEDGGDTYRQARLTAAPCGGQ